MSFRNLDHKYSPLWTVECKISRHIQNTLTLAKGSTFIKVTPSIRALSVWGRGCKCLPRCFGASFYHGLFPTFKMIAQTVKMGGGRFYRTQVHSLHYLVSQSSSHCQSVLLLNFLRIGFVACYKIDVRVSVNCYMDSFKLKYVFV